MGNVPFTITDALGYVAAGLILMVAAAIAVLGELPTEVSIVTGIGIGVAAYVVGHCISGVSTWALDRVLFNDRWGLGRPEKVLIGGRTARPGVPPVADPFRRLLHPPAGRDREPGEEQSGIPGS